LCDTIAAMPTLATTSIAMLATRFRFQKRLAMNSVVAVIWRESA
jgi:hypothetical protein